MFQDQQMGFPRAVHCMSWQQWWRMCMTSLKLIDHSWKRTKDTLLHMWRWQAQKISVSCLSVMLNSWIFSIELAFPHLSQDVYLSVFYGHHCLKKQWCTSTLPLCELSFPCEDAVVMVLTEELFCGVLCYRFLLHIQIFMEALHCPHLAQVGSDLRYCWCFEASIGFPA